MPKRARVQSGKKTGRAAKTVRFPAFTVEQGNHTLYVFAARASDLWDLVSINRREENKDVGYQRVLSNSRVNSIANYITDGNNIPVSILVAFDKKKAHFDKAKSEIVLQKGRDVGWLIDGQHRLAGAHVASKKKDIELCVVGIIGASVEEQVFQFITINREAKGVPTSVYLDLLKKLPGKKSLGELANERAADLANQLRRDPNSVFHNRIVATQAPRNGQISIVNFVRKVASLVHPEKGLLNTFELKKQTRIIDNYYKALRDIYKSEWAKPDPIFFKTLGFGAFLNSFELIFKEISMNYGGFTTADIKSVLGALSSFDFTAWNEYGTGNKAEMAASDDFLVDFKRHLETLHADKKSKQIRL